MAQCITCGTELHPERAQKYDYCMAPECQEKNAKGLTMVAVGMNKAADELMILDEQTRENLASGRYRDQRRGSFGPSAPAPGPARPAHPARPARTPRRAQPARRPAASPQWTPKQERLALLYNSQGLRPDEIAEKLGVSRYLATQIILAAKNRGKI
jgi:DNA-binding CsgD family transcriptional regulator